MKKIFAILLLLIFSFTSLPLAAEASKNNRGRTTVKSYRKKNGTYVKSHRKTVHYGHKKSHSHKRRK